MKQGLKMSNVIKKMRRYYTFKRWVEVLTICFVFTGMIVSTQGATVIADQSQLDEEEIRKWQKGQLDILEEDFIIIDDTSFLITNDTEFFGGRSDLEIGGIVSFKLDDDNKYIEAIYLDESPPAAETSSDTTDDDKEEINNNSSPGEMRQENGVWVN